MPRVIIVFVKKLCFSSNFYVVLRFFTIFETKKCPKYTLTEMKDIKRIVLLLALVVMVSKVLF